MFRAVILAVIIGLLLWACEPQSGCTDPSAFNFSTEAGLDDGSCEFELNISQAQLDAVTAAFKLNVTGDTLAGDITIPHILTDTNLIDPDSTYRDIFSSAPISAGSTIKQGTIIVKRIYLTNPDGSKGARSNTYVMIKQYPGYFPAGRDWEYVAIKYTDLTDFERFPNAILGDATLRGKLTLCGNCHIGETDGIFGN